MGYMIEEPTDEELIQIEKEIAEERAEERGRAEGRAELSEALLLLRSGKTKSDLEAQGIGNKIIEEAETLLQKL